MKQFVNMVKPKAVKLNLPNIRTMELPPKIGTDPYLDLFENIKKVIRDGKLEWAKLADNKTERYLRYQQVRLAKLAQSGKYERYWKLANHLTKSSKAFRMLALRNVRPNWYKDSKWTEVHKWMKKLNQISYRPSETFQIIRTPIPKPDGTTR